MNFSIILAHPDIDSFNHEIAVTAKRALEDSGVEVYFHDLYRESFPPLLPKDEIKRDAQLPTVISQHCEEIRSVDGIIIVHPNWWGQPPAILTGWVDRIMRPGVTYKFNEGDAGEGVPVGLLKAKIAIVFNTANTSPKRELEVFGDPLELIWKNCIFQLCGVPGFYRKTFSVMITSTPEQRKSWLEETYQSVSMIVQDLQSRPKTSGLTL
ncbi:MAG: flavodoxin family protein [Fibrobacter sp.]|nr:flavodoxin family protein [Fibrobacter sp.]